MLRSLIRISLDVGVSSDSVWKRDCWAVIWMRGRAESAGFFITAIYLRYFDDVERMELGVDMEDSMFHGWVI
jgi:hypothetical protein